MNVEWQAILSEASAMDEASDQELGRELEAVVRQHARFVYRVAYLLLRNHHDAEDATQETFARVWRHRRRWKIRSHQPADRKISDRTIR